MLVAHRRPDTGAIQPLQVHCLSVAKLCSELCKIIGLEKLGYLTGLLHDMGKSQDLGQRRILGLTNERFFVYARLVSGPKIVVNK